VVALLVANLNLIHIAKLIMEMYVSNAMAGITFKMVYANSAIHFAKHSINQMVIALPAMADTH
jgi:hypothetical protein